MTPPKCRVCGNEHYGSCAEYFAAQRAPVANDVANSANRSQGASEASGSHKPAKVGSTPAPATGYKKWRQENPELYKERQRKLMRARRAGGKA